MTATDEIERELREGPLRCQGYDYGEICAIERCLPCFACKVVPRVARFIASREAKLREELSESSAWKRDAINQVWNYLGRPENYTDGLVEQLIAGCEDLRAEVEKLREERDAALRTGDRMRQRGDEISLRGRLEVTKKRGGK